MAVLSRRSLFRAAVASLGAVAVGEALPGPARADVTAPTAPSLPRPRRPVSTLGGADAPAEAGAGLPAVLTPRALAPAGSATAETDPLVVRALPAPRVAVTAALPNRAFARLDFELRTLPPERQPYALLAPVPVAGYGVVDAHGVRMAWLAGQLLNHPTAQAQYGLALLESHRLTGDARYLALAELQAARLIARGRPYAGATFHPYDFDWTPHHTELRVAPWYSAMAQGQVLDFLTRLHVRTGNPGYLAEASSTFLSFLVPRVAGRPWVAWVTGGLLWLDEYPSSRTPTGDRTYNGHTFAAFGLYQYWLLTHDERAKQLAQGAFTTARTVYAAVRTPGWRSVYCLHDRCDSLLYHSTHVAQHLLLSTITGDPFFAAIADVFHADFPKPALVGTVVMATGRHAAYRFDAAGGVIAARIVTATRTTSAPTDTRTKVKGRNGIWYRITAGALSGYSVQEVPRYTWVRGQHGTMAYLPWRSARLLVTVGELVQPAPTSSGDLTKKPVALAAGTRFEIDGRALLNGIEHVRIAEGLHVGWWLPATSVRF